MNLKIIVSFLLVLSIVNVGYMGFLNYKLNVSLEQKQGQLDSIYEQLSIIAKNKNNNSNLPNNNFKNFDSSNDFFDDNSIFDIENRLNERMKDLFNDSQSQYGMDFDLNLVPKEGTYMNFSNSSTINGKKFSYSIRVSGKSLEGEVLSEDENKLKELEKSLKDLGLEITKTDTKINFKGDNVDYNEVLKLFNINAQINNNSNKSPSKNLEKEGNVF